MKLSFENADLSYSCDSGLEHFPFLKAQKDLVSELELQLNPSELTFFDDAIAGPSSNEIECQRPRTPFPTPEQASGVGAKRKLLTNNGEEQKGSREATLKFLKQVFREIIPHGKFL